MTIWQRKFWRRREQAVARATDAVAVRVAIGSLTPDQVLAVRQVVQRVIDGRMAVLAGSAEMRTESIHEMRGGIAALTEFSNGLADLWQSFNEE